MAALNLVQGESAFFWIQSLLIQEAAKKALKAAKSQKKPDIFGGDFERQRLEAIALRYQNARRLTSEKRLTKIARKCLSDIPAAPNCDAFIRTNNSFSFAISAKSFSGLVSPLRQKMNGVRDIILGNGWELTRIQVNLRSSSPQLGVFVYVSKSTGII